MPTAVAPTAEEFAKFLADFKAMAEKVAVLEAATKPQEEEVFEETTFYHNVRGSTFIVSRKQPDGSNSAEVLTFYDGKLTTADPVVIRALRTVADKPGGAIFTKPVDKTKPLGDDAVREVIKTAERSMDRLGPEATVRA